MTWAFKSFILYDISGKKSRLLPCDTVTPVNSCDPRDICDPYIVDLCVARTRTCGVPCCWSRRPTASSTWRLPWCASLPSIWSWPATGSARQDRCVHNYHAYLGLFGGKRVLYYWLSLLELFEGKWFVLLTFSFTVVWGNSVFVILTFLQPVDCLGGKLFL